MAGCGRSGLDLAGDLSMIFGVGLGKVSGAMVINRMMVVMFLGVVL